MNVTFKPLLKSLKLHEYYSQNLCYEFTLWEAYPVELSYCFTQSLCSFMLRHHVSQYIYIILYIYIKKWNLQDFIFLLRIVLQDNYSLKKNYKKKFVKIIKFSLTSFYWTVMSKMYISIWWHKKWSLWSQF